jgi:hypothetical protein
MDLQNENSYFVLGYTDAPTDIATASNAVLTSFAQDPTNAVNVAGGGSTTTGPGGVTTASSDYNVYVFNQNGEDIGIYIQLDNGSQLQVLIARPSDFADQMTLAQSTITANGVGVFGGADGADAATSMAGRPGEAPPITSESPVTDEQAAATDAGGQYTIPTGNVNVVWPAGWSVVGQDDTQIELTNASQTVHLTIVGDPLNGRTVDDWAADGVFSFNHDQGANAAISGPVVTESGWMLATDGDFGPRLAQGVASSDPAMGVTVFAANIAAGSDLAALATEIHGVTIDGVPALQGIEAVIPPAA